MKVLRLVVIVFIVLLFLLLPILVRNGVGRGFVTSSLIVLGLNIYLAARPFVNPLDEIRGRGWVIFWNSLLGVFGLGLLIFEETYAPAFGCALIVTALSGWALVKFSPRPLTVKSNIARGIGGLWNNSVLDRAEFFCNMLLLRLLFDLCANLVYATIYSFIFYLIYATLQLFMVRARVRDFRGNVKGWTRLYGTGLVVGGVLVLITIIPAFEFIAPSTHYNVINYIFNKLMIFPIIYLSIFKPPKDGDYIMLPELFQKFRPKTLSVSKAPIPQSDKMT